MFELCVGTTSSVPRSWSARTVSTCPLTTTRSLRSRSSWIASIGCGNTSLRSPRVLGLEQHAEPDRQRLRGEPVDVRVELPRHVLDVGVDELPQELAAVDLRALGQPLGHAHPPAPRAHLVLGPPLRSEAADLVERRLVEHILQPRALRGCAPAPDTTCRCGARPPPRCRAAPRGSETKVRR